MTPAYQTPSRHKMQDQMRDRAKPGARKNCGTWSSQLYSSLQQRLRVRSQAARELRRPLLAIHGVSLYHRADDSIASWPAAHRPNLPPGRTRQRNPATLTAHAR
jgi:hypothetical protein